MRHVMKVLSALICAVGMSSAKGGNIEDAKPPREFALLPANVKTNICQNVLKGVAQKDVFCGLVQIFPEDYFNDTYEMFHCSEEDSTFMEDLGLRVGRCVRGFPLSGNKMEFLDRNKLIYLNIRNPSEDEIRSRRLMVDGRVQYAPGVIKPSGQCLFLFLEKARQHEWEPEDAYINRKVCEMKMADWPDSVRRLWEKSVHGVISNCAFVVNRRYGMPPPVGSYREPVKKMIDFMYRSARLSRNLNPLIELSEREATEIVYLTALCRGRVRTMGEFNAAFVPKGETFLVRLTVPECETEIGRLLYDLARKRGLLGQKGG